MATPIYPKALASWTNRIDQVNTVWANDPNSLAAEIIAIETALGAMPQVERNPPVGGAVTYNSVSARITDAMRASQHPYVKLHNASFTCGQGGGFFGGRFNVFPQVVTDYWGFYNGADITIPASGVYLLEASQSWSHHTDGYVMHMLSINNSRLRIDRWNWADYDPTGTDYASTNLNWIGILNKGDRIRTASQNKTSKNLFPCQDSNLIAYYLRDLPPAGGGSVRVNPGGPFLP